MQKVDFYLTSTRKINMLIVHAKTLYFRMVSMAGCFDSFFKKDVYVEIAERSDYSILYEGFDQRRAKCLKGKRGEMCSLNITMTVYQGQSFHKSFSFWFRFHFLPKCCLQQKPMLTLKKEVI